MGLIKLQSSDRKVFEVDRELVQDVELIESILEHFDEDEVGDKPIALKEVDSTCLDKILQWLSYMKNSMRFTQADVNQFKTKFVDDNQNIIYGLINAANFLGIKDLMTALCRNVATKFEGKAASEIRQEFDITEN